MTATTESPSYVLITAARNEARYIEHPLRSVVAQSLPPKRWVIVSDGSTDETDDLVRRYADKHPFVRLVRREPDSGRNFGSKVMAIRAGLSNVEDIEYDFVGILDGDISFESDYYAEVMKRFDRDAQLGIAGGILYDDYDGGWLRKQISEQYSVGGPVQMFRRACFEAIGGFIPLPYGGEDAVAEAMVRMHGWNARTFPELIVHHHRRVGTEGKGVLRSFYDMGWREHVNGYHPVFEVARALGRMRMPPYVLGGLWHLAGFVAAKLRGEPVAVPGDYVDFLRREQVQRLGSLVRPKPDLPG